VRVFHTEGGEVMDAKEALEYARIALWSTRGVEAFAALSAVVDERDALKAEVERLQVQLAGCSTAALGWNEKSAKQGDYGWSAPYQDVLDLRQRCEKAEAELAAARPLLKEIEEAVEDELDLTLQSMRVWEAALAYRAGRAK
jgi:hypothetical protein